jgi:hypothetical protein
VEYRHEAFVRQKNEARERAEAQREEKALDDNTKSSSQAQTTTKIQNSTIERKPINLEPLAVRFHQVDIFLTRLTCSSRNEQLTCWASSYHQR